MMVGRSVHLEVEKAIATPGDVVLEVQEPGGGRPKEPDCRGRSHA